MKLLIILIFFHFINAQWNPPYWLGNGYPPQAVPNNNLAIGYPTAYGLWAGKANQNNGWNTGMWNGDNNGPMPNQGTGFGSPLKCMNGGAHIGQCRLDRDSICIALGGICVHGACCTTPFAGVLITSTSPKPSIEGEAPFSKGRTFKPYTTTKDPESYTVTIEPERNSEELDELTRLIEEAKTTRPVTMVTITEAPDAEEESDEEVNGKRCLSGLRPIGPCTDDNDCPALHHCEHERCCYIVEETWNNEQFSSNVNHYNYTNYPGFSSNYQPYR